MVVRERPCGEGAGDGSAQMETLPSLVRLQKYQLPLREIDNKSERKRMLLICVLGVFFIVGN